MRWRNLISQERTEAMRGDLKRNAFRVLAVGSMIALGSLVGSAQPTSLSSIAGTVRDPLGGVVVGAQITIKNLANDETRKTVSDALGAYTAEGLIPGSYEVAAVKYGFRDSRTRLVLETHKQSKADLKLYLAGVNGEDASSSTQLEDALSMRFAALEVRIKQLEVKVAHCREELWLATITT